ncbi:MAG: hypothetical protein JWM16_6284 [Verrucomicrobiales bacterium]|nr:hypothetical protein [Verrucomicrobiales bacterium]
MIVRHSLSIGAMIVATIAPAIAQAHMTLPKRAEAGKPFVIQTTGTGKAVIYIVGFGQAMRQEVQLGEAMSVAAGVLHNAGHYQAVLVAGSSNETGAFDVAPAGQVANVSFLAKPSRLPVGLRDGISGAVYTFDAYQNLIMTPTPVSFQLSGGNGVSQTRTAVTRNGYAWTQMDSAPKEGAAQFVARVGDISSTRIIQEVPGDPCGLRVNARPAGQKVELQTDPVKDCTGNAVPDGTIVTFTEAYGSTQTTVDVPLKRGIAHTELPAYNGAKISAAAGVVMGNEIRWGRQQ